MRGNKFTPLEKVIKKLTGSARGIPTGKETPSSARTLKGYNSLTGFTLLEVVIIMCVLGIVIMAVMPINLLIPRQSVALKEKTFATEKAMQMMEELRSVVYTANQTYVLEQYDNGAQYSASLTTNKNVQDPADPLSGNTRTGGTWKYCRQIQVITLANDSSAKKVFVRVYKTAAEHPLSPEKPLAELVSVLRVIKKTSPATQVFDVYLIAIENVPGWWSAIFKIKPIMDSVIRDLQTRTPGLEIRTHWIRKLAGGRDPFYTPYINRNEYTTEENTVKNVYFYPGKMKNNTGNNHYYYDSDLFEGRINIDGAVTHASSYSLADQYNHALRYPDEVALYGGDSEPSLRVLIEEMNSQPEKYRNALFLNLHGELLPCPPMRNYSDAAKYPKNGSGFPEVRVVTHSSRLRYDDTDTIELRVYPYVMTPAAFAHDETLAKCSVYLPRNIAINILEIKKCVGNQTTKYEWQTATPSTDYDLTDTGGGKLITLKNTPLRHALYSNNGGLPSDKRLYGLEYIPCPVEAAADFSRDLTDIDDSVVKNTARWRIVLDTSTIDDGMCTFETRLGDDLTTGAPANQPTNISRSYFWKNSDPPETEQYQFLGDPRHCPYADTKLNHRYNWYFKQISGNGYEGFDETRDYWSSGGSNRLVMDIPRIFQVFRTGLQRTNSVWTSITGWSNYYVGIGNEMGADACNGFPNGLPIHGRLWDPNEDDVQGVDEITTGTSCSVKNARLIAKADGSGWYSLPWLGELYPDNQYTQWENDGNLATGSNKFYRAHYTSVASELPVNPTKCTSVYGCSSFFNGAPAGANGPFRHDGINTSGTITAEERQAAKMLNFPLPSLINANRPFTLSYGSYPPEWWKAEYAGQRTITSVVELLYDSAYESWKYDACAQLRFENTTGVGYAIINGLAPQIDFGTAQMAKLAIINVLRGFMNMGLTSITYGRIPQVPLVNLDSPDPNLEYKNPGTIPVAWHTQWTRWDGELYTEAYSAGFTDPESIVFNLKYSADNGITWKFIQDNTSAKIGVRDQSHDLTVTSFTWDVSSFLKGSYQLRIEAYRHNRVLHYSYHQIFFYLDNQ